MPGARGGQSRRSEALCAGSMQRRARERLQLCSEAGLFSWLKIFKTFSGGKGGERGGKLLCFNMAARMVGGLGVLGAGGYMAYSMMSGENKRNTGCVRSSRGTAAPSPCGSCCIRGRFRGNLSCYRRLARLDTAGPWDFTQVPQARQRPLRRIRSGRERFAAISRGEVPDHSCESQSVAQNRVAAQAAKRAPCARARNATPLALGF